MHTVENPMVLIAGAGPTGLTAALELRRFGIPVRVIDSMDVPSATSRAVGIQARTLEEMELRGLAGEFIRLGHPAKGGSIYGRGRQLLRVDFTRVESHYNYLLFLSQADTERILRDALARDATWVEFGVKMVAFAQDEQGITATLEHKDGSLEKVTAAYLIDAEGAHSFVRNSLHMHFDGKSLDENYVLADLHIDGALPESDFHIFSSENGFIVLFPMGGSHFRLIANNPPDAAGRDANSRERAAPDLVQLQAMYDERAHIPARLRQLGWSSWFRINSRMVDSLKVGRVFLGGDAAHIHSPAGAQGMNTGIQDMMNLGWKLALVLKGKASEELLDTYQQDRLPVTRSILKKTEQLTDLMESQNPLVRSAVNHLAPLIAGMDFVQDNMTARISQIALNYRESTLSADQASGGTLRAGDRVPELRLRAALDHGGYEDGRLSSLLSPSQFTLLMVNIVDVASVQAQISSQLNPWREIIVSIHVEASKSDEQKLFRDVFGSLPTLVLIRPDAYIAFRGNGRSVSQLADYCRRWFSAQAQQEAAA